MGGHVVPFLLTSVDDLLDGFGHLPLEQGVEEFDQEDEAGAEHDKGPGQQHQPHGQVRQWCVGEEVLTCPTARLGKGLGLARPCSQTCPRRQPHTWTPEQHLPALPHIRTPAHLHHMYDPQPHLHLPAPCPVPQPCPSPPHPLTLLPGDVVEDLDALSAAVAGGRAVLGWSKPHSGHLQGKSGLQLAPQCPQPAPAHHPSSLGWFGVPSRAMGPSPVGMQGHTRRG